MILGYLGSWSTIYLQCTGIWNTKRPYKHCLQSKIRILQKNHHPSHINRQNRTSRASYKKCHHTSLISNLSHDKCVISMRLHLIIMETGTRWYAPIISSRVTGCGRPRQAKENHYGAHLSHPTTLADSVLSPIWWRTRAPITLKISITTHPVIG